MLMIRMDASARPHRTGDPVEPECDQQEQDAQARQ